MNDKSFKTEDPTSGVYFAQDDYASLLLRFLIIGIDTAVLLAISIIIGLILYPINRELSTLIGHIIAVMIPISYLYLAIYKRTDQSTVGYRVL